jgi:predicted phage terminase large subunit-like protein
MKLDDLVASLSPADQEKLLQQVQDYKDAVDREKCQKSFMAYVKKMWPGFIHGRHHAVMAKKFEEIAEGKLKRLCISLPPRHTKSEFGSFLLPSWYMGRFPDKKVMQASNTGELAVGFGRKVRNLVMSEQYAQIFPDVSLRQDSKAAGRWSTNKQGEYFAIGVGGTMTGRGADLCVRPWSKVVTKRGTVRADEVVLGDELLGQEGFAKIHHIVQSWHESTIALNNLHVSANHPVLVADKGFVEAEQVSVGDKLISLSTLGKLWVIYQQWMSHGLSRTKLLAGIRHLGQHAATMWESACCKLHDLWRSWYQSLRTLEVVSELHGRHGASTVAFAYAGQDQLRRALRAWECPVGGRGNSAEQQTKRSQDNRVWSNINSFAVDQKDWLVSGSDQASNLCDGHDARTSAGVSANELAAKASHSDGHDRQRDCQIQQLRGSQEKVWWRQCLERLIRACKNSLWVQVEVRRVNRFAHPPVEFVNFHVGKNNTFVCESYITHNCIIDDPHTEGEAALAAFQPEIYDKSYEWYTSGPRQRLQPNGAIVIIATRWSKRDLIGRVLKAAGELGKEDEWEVIELPAIMPSGKPLWPEFWSYEELSALRDELPPGKWNAQYQQNPTAEEGAIVKREWWKIWEKEKPPSCEFVIQSWDTAFTKGERNDYSACTTWGVFNMDEDESNVNIILLDCFQKRMEFPELKEKALAHYREWEPDAFIVEAKAAGAPLIFELRAMGIPVSEYTPSRGNDKFVRINSVADLFQSGKVWAPDTRWARELIENMAAFPNAPHDDDVDSAVQALIRFRQGGFLRLQTDERDDERSFKRKVAFY